MKEIISKDILAHNIKIVTYDGQKEVEMFYKMMIEHAFKSNEIDDNQALVGEIVEKQEKLNHFLDGEGKLLLLYVDKRLRGTISYSKPNELLSKLADRDVGKMQEIGTVFIDRNFQGYGLLSFLLNEVKQELKSNHVDDVCFDCGYQRAQKIWTHKYGKASIIKEDFWSEGSHHMIWFLKTKDL